jgi:hypothetical protein
MMCWIFSIFPLRVERYKFSRLHKNYEKNPMKAAHIDIQAYIHVLDLTSIYEKKRVTSRSRLTRSCRVGVYRVCSVAYCCRSKPAGEQRQATRGAKRLPGLLVGPGPSVNGPRSGTRPGLESLGVPPDLVPDQEGI